MDEKNPVDRLSGQQRRCLRLVGQGKTTAEIAFELGIAQGTVNGHIVAGMAKLGTATRRQAGYLVVEADAATQQNHTGKIHRVGDDSMDRQPSLPSSVRESGTAPYVASLAELPDGGQQRAASPLRTIVLIAILVVGLLVIVLALKPLVESARDLANVIQPARPH